TRGMNGPRGITSSLVKNGAAGTLRRRGGRCGSLRIRTPYPLQREFSRGETPLSQAGPIRVTVLVDTYNYGQYIEDAIDSVLAQEFPPEQREILVVDDGSTDDTAERVRKYGDRIQFFCKPNGGQASALNFGIARAQGEIVALLDGDDYWLPGKLQRV